MRVATLEMDLRTGEVDVNLGTALMGVRAAAAAGAELVAIPEMWPTSFVPRATAADFAASDAAVEEMARVTGELGIVVVGSAFGPRGGREESLPTNRAHVLGDGETLGWYDKVHLFSPTAEHLGFRAGDAPPPVVELPNGVRVAPIVCYDLRFPEVARAAFRAGAEVLVAVAQWPQSRAPHWKALLRGRAAEMEGFVVASNRIGVDEIGRRRMRLTFDGHAAVVGPSGEDVESVHAVRVGDSTTRLSVHDIDLGEARELRRAVPVLRDERKDLFGRWLDSDSAAN